MKAILSRMYGPPERLRWEEAAKPVPADDEVLIRIRAAAVNPLDWHMVRGEPRAGRLAFGLFHPKEIRVGRDVAGEVESVGAKGTQFRPGDAVFGVCKGSFAEYGCAGETKVAAKGEKLTFEQAASLPIAGLTALQGLRDDGRVQPGQTVLINGAGGGVGTFAVQIAKAMGAEVTGVCSARNAEFVRSLGAERTIDYAQEDFTRGARRYDIIFDLVGNRSFRECRRVLQPAGRFVGAAGPGPEQARPHAFVVGTLHGVVASRIGRQKQLMCMAAIRRQDLDRLRELVESGKIRPVIERAYSLSEAGKAMAHVEQGHARGKVVITVSDTASAPAAQAGG